MRVAPERPAVLILCAQIAALALTRRLGREGIAVGLWDVAPTQGLTAPVAMHSRFAHWRLQGSGRDEAGWCAQLLQAAERMGGQRPALIATSDETLLLLSRHHEALAPAFRFLLPDAALLELLLDKRSLHVEAERHGVAVPLSIQLQSEADLEPALAAVGLPCLLKSAYGKVGRAEMAPTPGKVKIESREELHRAYEALAAYDDRLILQEFLPGGAEQVALYNAYFNAAHQPVAIFTGRKTRQYPEAFGTASASQACPLPGLAEPLTEFLQQMRYVGPVDIGLKWDARAKVYKLLDVNPRLGQNYRTFVAHGRERADLGWLAYAELAGLPLARSRALIGAGPRAAVPRDQLDARLGWGPGAPAQSSVLRQRARRWKIEDADLRACRDLHREGQLSRRGWIGDWLRFHGGPHESAYWAWGDPGPFAWQAAQQWQLHAAGRSRPPASLQAEFNAWAERGRGEAMERTHARLAAAMFSHLGLAAGDRVLDLGCGTGWATRQAAACVGGSGRAVGVDVSDRMIQKAVRAGESGSKAEFVCAAADHIPLADGAFTHIFGIESFCYFSDPGAVLDELHRLLVPGGLVCLGLSLYRGNPNARRWSKQIQVPVQVRSARQWARLLRQAGWGDAAAEELVPSTSETSDTHGWACVVTARKTEYLSARA
ncbi:MAG: methyltransferase domain-containing protein [Terriglobales bacterium]